ncbi:recombinase family protein [Streptomyces sp. S.PNR 29]|uniref:recombinase family protein n=1 Tax=Streptomyces sp. S.PNR 29 TaxID=2973805 RepID=UPI0025B05BD4|nr:recombinase family protein [Streptomyces sp. S.PNR 29]MDN0193799.1 recombinase family protein [Streptomyces sp. S.PNR 29]
MSERSPRPAPRTPFAAPFAGRPKALAALRLSCLTSVTTSPSRQRSAIHRSAERLGFTLIAEAADLGVSAHQMSPFERPSLSSWLGRPHEYEAVVWSHVDRAVRSVAHMDELIAWGRQHTRTLVFCMPEADHPLVVTPQADGWVIQRCTDLAHDAEQEARTISARLSSSHEALRAAGRYGGGLVPFGYRKAPHPAGSGWCLSPDPETALVVRAIVEDVLAGSSLIAIARKLNDAGVPVPRDRHARLQGRPMGGRRHGRDFERFRWTSGTLSKVLRSPSLMGHRTHQGQTVRDGSGAPVLVGPPLLSDEEFRALQDALLARSNGTRRPRSQTTALLTAIAHCAGCEGRMYFALRKGYPYGDYVCRATARGEVCHSPAAMRSDWLEEYALDHYRRATATDVAVSRELLLRDGVRVTVGKGGRGGDHARRTGPDTSRLTFTIRKPSAAPQTS